MKSNLFKCKLLLGNLISVSGNKQKKKSLEQLFKKCPNADFTGFPLHLTVPSVPSQVGLAMGTPEVSLKNSWHYCWVQETAGKTRVGLVQPLPPNPLISDVIWVLPALEEKSCSQGISV